MARYGIMKALNSQWLQEVEMSQKKWLKHYPSMVGEEISYEKYQSIADAISQTCRKFPQAKAITCGLGLPMTQKDMSFQELERKADALAAFLQLDLGLSKGDRIAIMLPNIWQFPIAFFAAQKVGLICVNTNPLYTAREMEHQFKDSGAKALIIVDVFMDKLEKCIGNTDIEHVIQVSIPDELPFASGALLKSLMKAKGQIPTHGLKVHLYKDAMVKGSKKKYEEVGIDYEDVAVLQYTGGTTGVAKGAMLTQKNILANMVQIQEWAKVLNIGTGEVVLTALPLYHIFALSVNFLAFLALGSRMILVPRPVPIKNTTGLFKKFPFTVMTGVNTLYNAMNHCPTFQDNPPTELKIALAGGMALQSSVSKEFEAICGLPVTEGYGLTEASPVTHCNPVHVTPPPGSIGLPLPSTDARVVDPDGNVLGPGEEGELSVSGPQVMMGYWQRPAETDKVIKDGWLLTGDMARMLSLIHI